MSTIHDQIAEAKRELGMRKRVYPKRVLAELMTQQEADRYITLQQDIIATLEAIQMAVEPLLFEKDALRG